MLSAHFWMGTGVTLGVAAVMGLGLGSFVTSPQAPARFASATIDENIDDGDLEEARFTADKGPGVIHCTGCGPTLADRRWKADMAGLDAAAPIDAGYDVLPDDDALESAVEPPAPVRPSLPLVTRFATSDTAPPPVAVTREGQGVTPSPQILLPTAADAVLPQ